MHHAFWTSENSSCGNILLTSIQTHTMTVQNGLNLGTELSSSSQNHKFPNHTARLPVSCIDMDPTDRLAVCDPLRVVFYLDERDVEEAKAALIPPPHNIDMQPLTTCILHAEPFVDRPSRRHHLRTLSRWLLCK